MDKRIAHTIENTRSLDDLLQLEKNIRNINAFTEDISLAIRGRATDFRKDYITKKINLNLDNLSPAEEKIVNAVCEYLAIKKSQGRSAEYTFRQIRDKGLKGAAEASVCKRNPTRGFQDLEEANLTKVSYEKIIVDHSEEFSNRSLWYARRTLGLPNKSSKPPKKNKATSRKTSKEKGQTLLGRNPVWSRNELILALDLYLQFKATPPKNEINSLSELLRQMSLSENIDISSTYRNINGVSMKLSNFRRFDPKYQAEGKVGLSQGSIAEKDVWNEFYNNRDKLSLTAKEIKSKVNILLSNNKANDSEDVPYWVFVCNPKKWAIDEFLEQGNDHGIWGIRKSDRDKISPGQLGIIRVGEDRRTQKELQGKDRLNAGIYALCEIESEAIYGKNTGDNFWRTGHEPQSKRFVVKIRYLKTYLSTPLTIQKLKKEVPNISNLLLDGFQASSFPISSEDFHHIIPLLDTDLEDILDSINISTTGMGLSEMEGKYKNASPEVKERVSRVIERGPIGAKVKKENEYKCQLCEALGKNPIGFLKPKGQPYVEAHHVVPVSKQIIGSLSASNIMTLCPNHHRQAHYGNFRVNITDKYFEVEIEDEKLIVKRFTPKKSLS